MAREQDVSSWTDLLHSSTKLLEQAAPSAQFPPLQVRTILFPGSARGNCVKVFSNVCIHTVSDNFFVHRSFCMCQRNLDQLEALSKKLKARTLRAEAPSHSVAATRSLAVPLCLSSLSGCATGCSFDCVDNAFAGYLLERV